MRKSLEEMEIKAVVVRNNLRIDDGDLTSLEDSIRASGVLHPLIVGRGNVLIAGSRRLKACRNLGMKTVPVFKVDLDADCLAALDLAVAENECRAPLSAEEADNLMRLRKRLAEPQGNGAVRRLAGHMKRIFTRSGGESKRT